MNNQEFLELLGEVYGPDGWPKPLHLLRGGQLVDAGTDVVAAARTVRTTPRALGAVVEAPDRVEATLGARLREIDQKQRQRAVQMLGQLLVGRAGEVAFVDIYRSEMESHELELRDVRESRTDTDYRLYNGQGRPVYRMNIKFHGSRFRRAPELVGLQPEDSFALATYKIWSSLRKQDEEGLPYLFVVVCDPTLSGEAVGAEIPSRYIETSAFFHSVKKSPGKRDFEDRVVRQLVQRRAPIFQRTLEAIRRADRHVLSARKADMLVRKYLYDRVYALRLRGFAKQFPRAEVDMHLSMSRDLTPLHDFLAVLRAEGQAKVVTLLERGIY